MSLTAATLEHTGPAEAAEPPAPAPGDPLLACLEYVAEHYGLAFSARGALSKLPLAGPLLSADLVPRAAEQAGLLAEIRKTSPARLDRVALPAIALLDGGTACVVLKRTGDGSYVIVEPVRSRDQSTVEPGWFDQRYAGQMIFLAPTGHAATALLQAGSRAPSGHWFWSTVSRFWTFWLQIFFAAFMVNLLGLAVPLFTMNVYDRVIPNMAFATLLALGVGVALALVFDTALRQLRAVVLDTMGSRVDLHVSSLLFEHALALTMAKRPGSSGAIANQIREFEAVRDFFSSASIIAVTDLLFMGIFFFVLWHLLGQIVLVPVTGVVLVLAVTLLIQMPLARAMRLAQFHGSRRHSVLIESLVGIESIKAASAEGVMQRKWEDAVSSSAHAMSSARTWSSFALHFTSLVNQAVTVGIIIFGVFLVRDGLLTIGGLIAASLLAGRVLQPLGNIAMTLSRAQQAFSAMRGISELMALPREGQDLARSARAADARLEFRNLSFQYDGQGRRALDDVSVTIQPGERVGIIGKIGSGKTTLGKIAAGFFEPSQGAVLVGGIDTRAYETADLRAALAYVPQEPELFTGTLRDNIVLGNPHAAPEEIEEAVRTSGVDTFAAMHPLGLDMPIGERGRGLSGGQRQAVALARMLLRKPKILFLDEPSSAMDAGSEAALVRNLAAWCGPERTIVVCTHRGLFLNLVDRVIVLEAGAVVADGPREEVLARLRGPSEAVKAAVRSAASPEPPR
jgi:ATP-binding cassette, subfamily C, bacterial LapB